MSEARITSHYCFLLTMSEHGAGQCAVIYRMLDCLEIFQLNKDTLPVLIGDALIQSE